MINQDLPQPEENLAEVSDLTELDTQAGAEFRIGQFELNGFVITTAETAKFVKDSAGMLTSEKAEESQDSISVEAEPGILAVAVGDGIGGRKGGVDASRSAVNYGAFRLASPRFVGGHDGFASLFSQIDERVKKAGTESGGTTFSGVRIEDSAEGEGKTAEYLAVGDTPIFLLRDGTLAQLSREETLPDAKLRSGEITNEEYEDFRRTNGHVVTNSFGGGGKFNNHNHDKFELKPGDVLLIVSDGLTGDTPEQEPKIEISHGEYLQGRDAIEYVMNDFTLSSKEKVNLLRKISNKKGDDFTAVIIEMPSEEETITEDVDVVPEDAQGVAGVDAETVNDPETKRQEQRVSMMTSFYADVEHLSKRLIFEQGGQDLEWGIFHKVGESELNRSADTPVVVMAAISAISAGGVRSQEVIDAGFRNFTSYFKASNDQAVEAEPDNDKKYQILDELNHVRTQVESFTQGRRTQSQEVIDGEADKRIKDSLGKALDDNSGYSLAFRKANAVAVLYYAASSNSQGVRGVIDDYPDTQKELFELIAS